MCSKVEVCLLEADFLLLQVDAGGTPLHYASRIDLPDVSKNIVWLTLVSATAFDVPPGVVERLEPAWSETLAASQQQ